MQDLISYVALAPTLLLVAARLAGMLLVAPVFAHTAVPVRLRVLAAMVMAVAVVGRLGQAVALPPSIPAFVLAAGGELAIGAGIGYVARLIFAGVELGAFHVGAQMGVSLGDVYGQTGDGGGDLPGGLFGIVAIAIFLVIGGHRQLIAGLLDSLTALPPGGFSPQRSVTQAIGGLLGGSFELALRVAAPVLITMLLATAAMGLLQKTLPQCHILSTGLPARALAGLATMAAGIAALAWAVEAAWSRTSAAIGGLLKTVSS